MIEVVYPNSAGLDIHKEFVTVCRANMAMGRMRKKQDKLARALVGKLTDHHRFMLDELMDQLDFLGQRIAKIEERIEEQMAQRMLARWPARCCPMSSPR